MKKIIVEFLIWLIIVPVGLTILLKSLGFNLNASYISLFTLPYIFLVIRNMKGNNKRLD